ncbi:MAG: ATP-grasp domain-containing protein [Mesorhizobium sp.]|uniref:ATP-grasp domain-containing protein n=1 Tax=Mesorhizobium sp. TaxID=1871066 RepID=UPI000FE5BC0F|nr:ATP-grasp domain-containing protein [Mesorhizobium sp.]RWM09942.1 MAG: ATP-grasp domain-containing protein [Mesorhizobium sp.]
MSQHIVFIDTNSPGIETMRLAKQRGLRVSLIRSGYHHYVETERVKRIFSTLDTIVSIPDSTVDKKVLHAVRQLAALAPIDAVISELEPCVDVAARVCGRLGIPFTSASAVTTARDKTRAREVILRAGLHCPRFRPVTTPQEARAAAEAIGTPVVVKPQTGFDSLLATVAPTPPEAELAAQKLLSGIDALPKQLQAQFRKGILVEEYLSGPLVSAEIGVRDGRFYRFMMSDHTRAREDECIEIGASMPANLTPDQVEACFRYAEAVARALGFDLGIFHAEMIATTQGPALVEMNSRLMGGVMPHVYRHLTGEMIQERLLDIHLGLPISEGLPKHAGYVSARNIMPDRDAALANHIDVSWLEEYGDQLIEFDPHRLDPGIRVQRRETLGWFHVRAGSFAEANTVANAILGRFEKSVGIPLMR